MQQLLLALLILLNLPLATPVLADNWQQLAENVLDNRISQFKRSAIQERPMEVRLQLVASPVIQAMLLWDENGTIQFPNPEAMQHVSDRFATENRRRFEQMLSSANPTVWQMQGIDGDVLEYCRRDAMPVCVAVNTRHLAAMLEVEADDLLQALFPKTSQHHSLWLFALGGLLLVMALWMLGPKRAVAGAENTLNHDLNQFMLDDLTIDLRRRTASRDSREVALSERDLKILQYLHQRPNEVISKDVLYDAGWGRDFMPSSRALEQHIITLRRKLDPQRQYRELIETVHGQGYRYSSRTG